MRLLRPRRTPLACLTLAAAAACGDPTGPGPRSGPNYVRLASDPGEVIGGGRSYEYTQANAVITVVASGRRLDVHIEGDEWWNGAFQLPNTVPRLQPGTYSGLQSYPFLDARRGGLDWSGEGSGCETEGSSFTVEAVAYEGDSLTAIDLRFEQHCKGLAPALRGAIHWRADDTTRAPGPVMPAPSNLWQPPADITPASGDYVYLQSDQGDYVAQGGNYLYTEPTTPITVTSSGGGQLSVQVGPFGGWRGEFATMATVSRFEPGYYGGLQRLPFHNPMKGGLDWSGFGRGCNTLTGWFVVDSVTYAGVELAAITLRFEQHCEGGAPALRGKIRWTR